MQLMERFINAFRGREYPSKNELLREGSPTVAGDDNDNRLNSSMTEDITSQEILHRLGSCATENSSVYSEERDIPLIRQTETWDCGESK
jgi:hypothetical protein